MRKPAVDPNSYTAKSVLRAGCLIREGTELGMSARIAAYPDVDID